MKYRAALMLVLVPLAGPWAQETGECLGFGPDVEAVVGGKNYVPGMDAPNCHGPVYDRDFKSPAGATGGKPVRPVLPVAPVNVAEELAPEPDAVDYNARQMRGLGRMDAMQGRPINVQHAGDLDYLQGYTAAQGQRGRAGGVAW